jgi:hypothetical protein
MQLRLERYDNFKITKWHTDLNYVKNDILPYFLTFVHIDHWSGKSFQVEFSVFSIPFGGKLKLNIDRVRTFSRDLSSGKGVIPNLYWRYNVPAVSSKFILAKS